MFQHAHHRTLPTKEIRQRTWYRRIRFRWNGNDIMKSLDLFSIANSIAYIHETNEYSIVSLLNLIVLIALFVALVYQWEVARTVVVVEAFNLVHSMAICNTKILVWKQLKETVNLVVLWIACAICYVCVCEWIWGCTCIVLCVLRIVGGWSVCLRELML